MYLQIYDLRCTYLDILMYANKMLQLSLTRNMINSMRVIENEVREKETEMIY